ncbi:MAG: hypothetical protein ACE5H9_21100, partial [Anaerolineae bacterium]
LTDEAFPLDPPLLAPDLDVDRLVARQKEMMDACFGGIGQETKEEKRQGLAMQQLDIEQRHALRLLLGYEDVAELTTHLQRCLDDPAYGYGQRGDNGRTLAQGLVAVAEGDLAEEVAAWLNFCRDFQQAVLAGEPLSLRTLFDTTELDTFRPVLRRLGQAGLMRLGGLVGLGAQQVAGVSFQQKPARPPNPLLGSLPGQCRALSGPAGDDETEKSAVDKLREFCYHSRGIPKFPRVFIVQNSGGRSGISDPSRRSVVTGLLGFVVGGDRRWF